MDQHDPVFLISFSWLVIYHRMMIPNRITQLFVHALMLSHVILILVTSGWGQFYGFVMVDLLVFVGCAAADLVLLCFYCTLIQFFMIWLGNMCWLSWLISEAVDN